MQSKSHSLRRERKKNTCCKIIKIKNHRKILIQLFPMKASPTQKLSKVHLFSQAQISHTSISSTLISSSGGGKPVCLSGRYYFAPRNMFATKPTTKCCLRKERAVLR